MSPSPRRTIEERVLVLAPTTTDASITHRILTEAGLACQPCANLTELCREIDRGVGAVLATEELLTDGDSQCLVDLLDQQPAWSDLPILLLTSSGADSEVAAWAMDLLGNVTVIERPVRVTTLISGVRTALRARGRQYELRGQVETLRKQGERLRLLWDSASVLLTTAQPDAMMRALFAKLTPHLELDAYFNFMVNESGDALHLESCVGISEEEARKIQRLDFGQAVCGTVALLRQPITASYIQQSDDPKVQIVKGFGLRVYACNPLMAGDRLLGTLSFASRSRDRFESDEFEFLQTVCHYVAYAYERLRLIHELREADRKKDDFLATLAHELRNPLAPIRNAAHYIRLQGPGDPDLQNARDIIDRQVRQMTRLVDDLLDISRITQGKIVLQNTRINLGIALANAIEASRPAIESGGHELSIALPSEPLYVNGDFTRLSQIFGNLLTNAAKYTDRGGSIRVVATRHKNEVVITVKDNGIGIAPEHLAGLFDMFSQVAPALERSQGGLGIGLSLVRRLVEMHGGKVEAASEGLGQGSTFSVRLPLLIEQPSAETAHDNGQAVTRRERSPGTRIVVADDNVDSARSLAMMLSVMGHEVRTAFDGFAAVELAEEFRPDVILLDIGMPRMNGYEAAKKIRSQPWSSMAVLVALTGWGQDEDKRRAKDAGFDRHFTKPVDPTVLERLFADRSMASSGRRS